MPTLSLEIWKTTWKHQSSFGSRGSKETPEELVKADLLQQRTQRLQYEVPAQSSRPGLHPDRPGYRSNSRDTQDQAPGI